MHQDICGLQRYFLWTRDPHGHVSNSYGGTPVQNMWSRGLKASQPQVPSILIFKEKKLLFTHFLCLGREREKRRGREEKIFFHLASLSVCKGFLVLEEWVLLGSPRSSPHLPYLHLHLFFFLGFFESRLVLAPRFEMVDFGVYFHGYFLLEYLDLCYFVGLCMKREKTLKVVKLFELTIVLEPDSC